MGQLDDRVAFVTGAARGQGRSHAVRLAREGADILAVDICEQIDSVGYDLGTREELEETAEMIAAVGRRVVARPADVRDVDALRGAVAAAVEQFGRLDIVVANAGITTWGLMKEGVTEDEAWDDTIAVNLKGVWNTVRAAIPPLIDGGRGGSVILTSSTAGLKGLTIPGQYGNESYGAAKHGVVGLMRQFAVELSPHSIRVNAIHPTGVNTPMVVNPLMEKFFADLGAPMPNLLPVDLLEPSDISDAMVFLASDGARYITGVSLPVDAGFTTI